MKYKLLKSYLSESDRQYYERLNKGYVVNTADCLQVMFDDVSSVTYVIFEGPKTLYNMCRDCKKYYEINSGNHIYKVQKEEQK